MKRSSLQKSPLYNYNAVAKVTPLNPNFVQLEVGFTKIKTSIERSYCREVTIWLPFEDHNTITAYSGFERWQMGSGELVDHPKKRKPEKMLRYVINDHVGEPSFDEKEFGFGFKIDKSEYNNLPNLTMFVQETSKGESGEFIKKDIREVSAGIVDASVKIDYFIALDGTNKNDSKKIKTTFSRGEDIKLIWSGHNVENYELIINERTVANYDGKQNFYIINKETKPKECIPYHDSTLILKATGDKLKDVTFKSLNLSILDPLLSALTINKDDLTLRKNHIDGEPESYVQNINFADEQYRVGAKIVGVREKFDGALMQLAFHTGNYNDIEKRMTIRSNGKVGIGTGDPTTQFHVKGDTKIEGKVEIGTKGGKTIKNDSENQLYIMGNTKFDGDIVVHEHTTHLSCGMNGIGQPLDDVLNIVNGNLNLKKLHEERNSKTWEQSIVFKDEKHRDGVKIAAVRADWATASMKLSFYTGVLKGNQRDFKEHLSIDHNGRVSIGALKDKYNFYVKGNSRFDGSIGMGGNLHVEGKLYVRPANKHNNWNPTDDTYYAAIDGKGEDEWAIWKKKSDIQLKKNIQPMVNSLNKILALNGIAFDWVENHLNDIGNRASDAVSAGPNASPEKQKEIKERTKQEAIANHDIPQIGFIAQEVEQIFPEWVRDGDDGMKEINLSQLSAVLVEAIKELKEEKDLEIEQLSKQNQELKFEMKKMKAQINLLMKKIN